MAQTLNTPQVLNQPIANNGDKNVIPNTNDQSTGLMSMSAGFPPVTSQRIADGGIPPRRSDVNGALNLISQQHYFLQNGGTYTFRQDVSNAIGGYPKNAILYYEDPDGNLTLVRSLIENNTGNFINDPSLIDGVNWERLSLGIANANIGQIIQVACALDYTPFGTLPCDGSQYSSSRFPTLWSNYLTAETPLLNVCTMDEWNNEVSATGQCLKFGIDTTSNVFKVPLIKNGTHLQQALTDDELSKHYNAGAPALNVSMSTAGGHTHTRGTMNITGGPIHINAYGPGNITSGAFSTVATGPSHNDSGGTGVDISFNAANAWTGSTSTNGAHTHTLTSNTFYGGSTTIQPVSFGIRFFVVVANAVRNESMMDWSQWQTDLQNRANIDLSNLSELGEKHFLNYNQVTNCLLEIPQDVILELNDGTLTLKAGSKIYIPNGFEADGVTPKFDVVVITSDSSIKNGANQQEIILSNNGNIAGGVPSAWTYSGDNQPTVSTTFAIWYDTANNKIKQTSNNGSTWLEGYSLPIALSTSNTAQYVSIDQIFNGFGYIGSTLFLLPGVKGLYPNGRNEDGSLKSIEYVSTKVSTITNPFGTTPSTSSCICIKENGEVGIMHRYVESETTPTTTYTSWYNPKTNKFLYTGSTANSWTLQTAIVLGYLTWDYVATPKTNIFTSLKPKLPFYAVDRNDSSWLSGLSMPSSKTVSLSAGVSGTYYTAPVNGYFEFGGKASSASISYINAYIVEAGLQVQNWIPPNYQGNTVRGFIPCKKGQRLSLHFYQLTIDVLFFIYAEGEK